MALQENVGGLDRAARGLLAVALTLVAVSAFRGGRRRGALLAALGALGFGFNAVTCVCGLNRALGFDTTRGE